MLNTDVFVEQLTQVYGLSNGVKVDRIQPNCEVCVDDILCSTGFEYRIGQQSFFFNLRHNPNLIEDIRRSELIDSNVQEAVWTVLDFLEGRYKVMRSILSRNASDSWYCAVCLALDYACGLDGERDEIEAVSLLDHNIPKLLEDTTGDVKLKAWGLFTFQKLKDLDSDVRKRYLELVTQWDDTNAEYAFEYAATLQLETLEHNKETALHYYRKAAELDKTNAEYAYNYARYIHKYVGDRQASMSYYERAANLSRNAKYAYDYACLLSGSRREQEAFAYYKKAAETLGYGEDFAFPSDAADCAFKYASLLSERGDFDDAFLYYKKAAEWDVYDARYAFRYATLLSERDDNSTALLYYERAAKLDLNNAEYAFRYATIMYECYEDADLALPYYERAAEIDTKNAEYAYKFAMVLENEKYDRDKALLYYKRASELDKDNAEYAYEYGKLLYYDNNLDEAIQVLIRAASLSVINSQEKECYYTTLAEALYYNREIENALVFYEKAATMEEKGGETSYWYAHLLSQRGDNEKAIPFYKKSVELDKENSKYAHECADALKETGRKDESLLYYKLASLLDMDNFEYAVEAANMFLYCGDEDSALSHLGKAADLEDNCEYEYSYKYANLLFKRGERRRALTYFEKAAKQDYDPAMLMTGISYALGYHISDDGEFGADMKTALMWLERSTSDERHAYISYLRGNSMTPDEMIAVHTPGAICKFGISQFWLSKAYFLKGLQARNQLFDDNQAMAHFSTALKECILCNMGLLFSKWPDALSWFYNNHFYSDGKSLMARFYEDVKKNSGEISYYIDLIKAKEAQQKKKSGFLGSLFSK